MTPTKVDLQDFLVLQVSLMVILILLFIIMNRMIGQMLTKTECLIRLRLHFLVI